ncbi:MAG TPA: hypothetical protein VGR43_07670 [Dehalococcoidia bacterium]|nr:hypothetical protein [Dehalococcoidia bacterium]
MPSLAERFHVSVYDRRGHSQSERLPAQGEFAKTRPTSQRSSSAPARLPTSLAAPWAPRSRSTSSPLSSQTPPARPSPGPATCRTSRTLKNTSRRSSSSSTPPKCRGAAHTATRKPALM